MASSGALVPKATTVSPITKGDMPNLEASRDAPCTSHSAPKISNPNPAKKVIPVISVTTISPGLYIYNILAKNDKYYLNS